MARVGGGVIRCGEEDGGCPRGLLPDLPDVIVVECCCHCDCDQRMALENRLGSFSEAGVVSSCCFEVEMMAASGGSEFASAWAGPVVGASIPSVFVPAFSGLDIGYLALVLFFSPLSLWIAQLFTG
ncbi:hypothetical protein B0T09DRAFT_325952 [Sordaria sp. MPI-SDFR-AT-0083]|nr:hypothetical protein B0T09DRAFT_325952 [Sordaria sp. MPI-SDFR-AT-0083]